MQFCDGHTERWWGLEAAGRPYGRDKAERLVIASTDPAALAAVGPWPYAASGPGWSRGSCWGATGGRGPPSPHCLLRNGSWTGRGRGMRSIAISDDNKLLLWWRF
jgi:hypothetical protein